MNINYQDHNSIIFKLLQQYEEETAQISWEVRSTKQAKSEFHARLSLP